MESTKSDWSSLDHDLLSLVLKKLPLLRDYLHFHVVCKSWHDISERHMDHQLIPSQTRNIPFLLVPTRDGSENERRLYILVNNKNLNFQVSLPFNKRCCGSSHGWLLFNSKTSFTMLNPIIGGKTINLPPVKPDFDEDVIEPSEEESYYPTHVTKAVLSCDPSLYPNDYEVVVIYLDQYKLAIFKAGDKDWTPIEDHPNIGFFDDVIYHKDSFYAIDHLMGVGRITVTTCADRKTESIDEKDCVVTEIAEGDIPPRSYKIVMVTPRLLSIGKAPFPHCNFLVESSNKELVCALRIMDMKKGEEEDIVQLVTFGFRVYRLVNSNQVEPNLKQWVKIDTLGDDALFLGDNHSMAINVDGMVGYKKNSIYYTDNWNVCLGYGEPGPRDVGVFHLENQSIAYHYELDAAHRHMPPAIWFSPSLEGCKTI